MKTSYFALIPSAIILFPFLAFAFPQLVGGSETYIVRTGSMEPSIPVGSVIFTKDVPPESLEEKDIITFQSGDDTDSNLITHRIIDIRERNGIEFKTKGDANEDPDSGWISQDQVKEKHLYTVPYFGFLLDGLKSPAGIFLLIVIPGALIVSGEIRNILNEIEIEEVNSLIPAITGSIILFSFSIAYLINREAINNAVSSLELGLGAIIFIIVLMLITLYSSS